MNSNIDELTSRKSGSSDPAMRTHVNKFMAIMQGVSDSEDGEGKVRGSMYDPTEPCSSRQPAEEVLKPRAPLKSYHLFLGVVRQRILEHGSDRLKQVPISPEEVMRVVADHRAKPPDAKRRHRKTPGMIGFPNLSRLASGLWKTLDVETKGMIQNIAAAEKREFKEWNNNLHEGQRDDAALGTAKNAQQGDTNMSGGHRAIAQELDFPLEWNSHNADGRRDYSGGSWADVQHHDHPPTQNDIDQEIRRLFHPTSSPPADAHSSPLSHPPTRFPFHDHIQEDSLSSFQSEATTSAYQNSASSFCRMSSEQWHSAQHSVSEMDRKWPAHEAIGARDSFRTMGSGGEIRTSESNLHGTAEGLLEPTPIHPIICYQHGHSSESVSPGADRKRGHMEQERDVDMDPIPLDGEFNEVMDSALHPKDLDDFLPFG